MDNWYFVDLWGYLSAGFEAIEQNSKAAKYYYEPTCGFNNSTPQDNTL